MWWEKIKRWATCSKGSRNRCPCVQLTRSLFIRPPGTVVPDGLLFYRRCFFFRQPNLQGPSVDRCETLPHDRNLAAIAG